jgi:hypothetical protein
MDGRIIRALAIQHGSARFSRQVQQLIEQSIDTGELIGGQSRHFFLGLRNL